MENSSRAPRAAGYVRVSSFDQAAHGWSLSVQRERIAAYCAARGWDLVEVYADEGVSGKGSVYRPAFERMLDDLTAKDITRIVAMKLDRLGRSAGKLLNLYDRLERRGVGIVTIEDSIDTSTAQGRLFRTILAGVAEFERDVISERTRVAVRAAMQSGRRVGQPPYGFTVVDGRLAEHAQEQQVLQRIVRAAANGQTLIAIAEALNTDGVRPRHSRAGAAGRWHPTSIKRVLDRHAADAAT